MDFRAGIEYCTEHPGTKTGPHTRRPRPARPTMKSPLDRRTLPRHSNVVRLSLPPDHWWITALATIVFSTAIHWDLPAPGSAHELKIQVPAPDGGTRTVEVEHQHLCEEWRVPLQGSAPGPRPDTEEAVAVILHRKELTVVQKQDKIALMDAWIKAYQPGRVHRYGPPTNATNCHGFTFDNGQSWVESAVLYLKACHDVQEAEARPGDVVIYRHHGHITHSGRVSGRAADGTVWVRSSWGNLGEFEHAIDAVSHGQERIVYPSAAGETKTAVMSPYGRPELYRC